LNNPDILDQILNYKKQFVAERKSSQPVEELKRQAGETKPCLGFYQSIRKKIDSGNPAVVAEIKKASPSRGVIREDFDPVNIAIGYEKAGAACLSVLTDEKFFQGSAYYLEQIKPKTGIPVLRKDFIIDPYQVYESKVIGADCILLIASALSDGQLQELSMIAIGLGLDVLVEVHNREELERGMMLRTPLIGINNRNLHTFEISLETTIGLLPDVFPDRTIITESGIHHRDDITLMRGHNVHAFLIGETLMQAPDPGAMLRSLIH